VVDDASSPSAVFPNDPSQPLTVRATFDGIPVEKSIRLDRGSLERKRLQYKNASGPILSGSRSNPGTSKMQRTQDQQIAFMGDFKYMRGDGVEVGADHIRIKLWDEDALSDELMWSGETDANGHFEGAISWDDCDISGCDAPDMYVEVITTSNACDVQDDSILEETYSWVSPVLPNFNGTFVDFGGLTPGVDVFDNAAVHIFSSVTRSAIASRPDRARKERTDGGRASTQDGGDVQQHTTRSSKRFHIRPRDKMDGTRDHSRTHAGVGPQGATVHKQLWEALSRYGLRDRRHMRTRRILGHC
jgi:hypothetical protein